MKNKIIQISLILIMIYIFPILINANGTDINNGANSTLLTCTGGCDSSWPAPMQGMRITLVYSDEAKTTVSCDLQGWGGCTSPIPVTPGDRVKNNLLGGQTVSADYSNHYYTINKDTITNFGYNSKLDYSKGTSFSPRTGYTALDPAGSLPNYIADGSGRSDVLENYVKNSYLNLNNEPYNLRKLLLDLKAYDIVGAIDYYGGYENGKFTKKIFKKDWEVIEKSYPYALLIEPVIYIDITDTKNLSVPIANARVAMTAMEAAKLYKNIEFKSTGTPNECYACGVILRDLPRSIYTIENHFGSTFTNSINGYSSGFNSPTVYDSFDAGGTKYMKPELISYSKFTGGKLIGNSVGLGYADLYKYIDELPEDPPIIKDTPTCPGCPPPPDHVTPDDESPVVPKATCSVGSCTKPPYFIDEKDWTKIIGEPSYIDSSKGSSFAVTDWAGSPNVLNYSTSNTPTNKKLLCPVYCRNEVTTDFPSMPSGGLAAGTNFQYAPISTSTYRECQSNIELELWQKDVAETEERLEEAERQYGRVQRKQAVWLDVSDNGVVNNGGGSITSTTYCRLENQSKTPQTNTLSVSKSETCQTIKVFDPIKEDFVLVQRCSTTYNYNLTCIYNGNVFSRTASSGVSSTGKLLNPNPLPAQTRTFGKITMVTSASISSDGASGTANCSVTEEVEVGKKYDWNYQYFDLNYPYGQDPINKLITYQPTYVSIPGISDSNVYCAGEGSYANEVTMWRNAVNYYRTRLATLKSSMTNCYNWSANVTTPNISVTQRQNLLGGTTKTDTYNLVVAKTSTSGGNVKKSCIDTNNTGICNKTYTTSTGAKIEMYTDVQSSLTRKIDYRLPSGTNRYILKPSGQVVSNLPAPGVNYIDVGYENYTVAFNSPSKVGSGTMTINYSNLGDKCTGTAGYGRYTCSYKGYEDAEVRSFDFVYHTIDLSNPFSYYQDGSKREPGFNWRYDKTLESKYITNNRGVAGDAVYGLEPMYVIDFTGKNKTKLSTIRQYNIANGYSTFKLKCSAGEQCKSDFLRGNIMNGAISGCGLDGNWNSCSGR